MIGSPTRSRTQARPSTSSATTGCSTNSTPRSATSRARMTWTASSRRPALVGVEPDGDVGSDGGADTAATRCTSVRGVGADLHLQGAEALGHPRAGGVGERVSRACRQGDVGRQHIAYAVRPGREDRGDRGALRLGDEVVQGRVDRRLGAEVAGHGALDEPAAAGEVVAVVERLAGDERGEHRLDARGGAGQGLPGHLPHLRRLAPAGAAVAVADRDDDGVGRLGAAQRGDERACAAARTRCASSTAEVVTAVMKSGCSARQTSLAMQATKAAAVGLVEVGGRADGEDEGRPPMGRTSATSWETPVTEPVLFAIGVPGGQAGGDHGAIVLLAGQHRLDGRQHRRAAEGGVAAPEGGHDRARGRPRSRCW